MDQKTRLEKLRLGDEIEVEFTPRRAANRVLHRGKIVHIFVKGLRPETGAIEKYYKPEDAYRLAMLHFTPVSDRLVLQYDEDTYYIFARNPKFFDVYDAEIRMIRPVLQRRQR